MGSIFFARKMYMAPNETTRKGVTMSNIIELAAARVLERYFDTRIEMSQIASWGSETGDGVTLITVFYQQSATQGYVCLINIIDESNKALVKAIPIDPRTSFKPIEF